MSHPQLTLSVLPNSYAVCRLQPGAPVPAWASRGEFWSVVRTKDELSIVCDESSVPVDQSREGGWRLLKLEGPFAFTLTGILASVAQPLAEAGVSIFALSTFDTDYVLVKAAQLETARQALHLYGHTVRE